MQALFWYIILAVVGVVVTIFAIYKKRNITEVSTYIVYYLFATSITWIGEFVALGVFNGYAYKPGVFADPWAENITGHLLLNSTIWPGAATLMVAYSLGYGWNFMIIAFFIFADRYRICGSKHISKNGHFNFSRWVEVASLNSRLFHMLINFYSD